jgi:two-component system, cell cycle sensor histidine kinase and response regulator CckA
VTPTIEQIKSRVRWIVCLILLAVLGVSVWSITEERANTLLSAEKLAEGYARALAEHSESAFSEGDGMLRVLAQEVRRKGGLEHMDRLKLLEEMRRQIDVAPQIGSLFLVDQTGLMRLNSGEEPDRPINVADRDYFRSYLDTPGLQLSFSRPLMSRLANRWRFNLMRPLNPPSEPFCGLVALGFNSDYFDSFFSPGVLGPGGRAFLVHTSGMPLVCAPQIPGALQMDFRTSVLFRDHLPNRGAGVYQVQNQLTKGEPLIVSYQRLARYHVVALVALNKNDVLGPWARKAAMQSGLMLGLCLVIIILMQLVCNHLDRLRLALGTVNDQQAQLLLKAAQIDAASEAILQVDLDGRLMQFNQALCAMTGYLPDELAGRRLQDIEPPALARRVAYNMERLKESGQLSFESAYLAKDGSVVPVEVNCRMMQNEGRPVVLSVARDITLRKKDELREQARRRILEQIAGDEPLEQLLEGIVRLTEQELPDALCSVLLADERGTRLRHGAAPSLPTAYNQAVNGIAIARGMGSCGTAAFLRQRVVVPDIVNHPYWKGFQPARDAGLKSCWSEPVLSAEGSLLGTFAIYHREVRSPSEMELSLMVSAAHLASIAIGRVQGDERRQVLEDQLRQVQKIEAVGQLAAGIAHDFNNLLTPIFVYGDLIRRALTDAHPQIKQVDAVILAAHKAGELTRKLLSFGRKQPLCFAALDFNEVINSFADIMRTTVRESISLELRLAPERAMVQADRGQLEQVLLNLTVNAQDAIETVGSIVLETGHLVLDEEYARLHPGVRPGRYVMLAVSDNGCGMGEETLRHIYEPFFTTKETGRGTGLGLATVYGIIKQHEGYIEVSSQLGAGTNFQIFLPLSAGGDARRSEPSFGFVEPNRDGTGKTILLVEDNAMIREMAQELLEGYGYLALVAGTPAEALDLVATPGLRLDLLVSDVVMPGMNGPDLHERLLELYPELPVLFISGYTGSVALHQDAAEPGAGFLTKPFTLEQFLEKIRRILG